MLKVVVPEASRVHPAPTPPVAVTVSTTGVELAVPPADTLSQLETVLRLPMVKGVPPVAAELTLTVCAEVTAPEVLLQVNVSELGEGTSAEPLLVVMLMTTGMLRTVPTVPVLPVGVKISCGVPPGTVPWQPGAIVTLKTVAVLVEVTDSPALV